MRARQMAAGLGIAALVGLAGAIGFGVGPASAHVTVNAQGATQGGYAKLAFRVPNERDNASTVKVEVNIPPETAIASVSTRPTPGWTATTEKSKLATPLKAHGEEITEAITKITWTATAGSEVKPGEFQEFEVSAGPLPEVDQIVFKALQTYSNNEIVRWIDEPTGGEEAEHPAPVLKLAKAGAAEGAAASPAANANVNLASSAGDGDDSSAGSVAGVAGLVLALAALIFAVLAWRRSGSRPS
ncbi:YcnI family protein [Asanoa sp. WMMD1127]|uniref:YcnI family copper-binding membrane protein n=1 Tax=Asanoa sp. WMMD1127 TaxID=3016107 RepID=UPI002416FDAB|nr:YcnI family protein [Asanoa sp. WMMD1127]MDG4827457.1 YcnI family protein [Asanoa sp. WMMD1127]